MKILKILGSVLLVPIVLGAIAYWFFLKPADPLVSEADRNKISVMPLPKKLDLDEEVKLSKEWNAVYNENDLRLSSAVDRIYSSLAIKEGNGVQLVINVEKQLNIPQYGNDESYFLSIRENRIEINSNTTFGAIHALTTVRQMINVLPDGSLQSFEAEIEDIPRYGWRGLLIDAGRHWMPKHIILENLEAMSYAKLNVLHWHLSEYQGFRVESKTFPKLHELGSNGNYYTQDDIREIVEFAADRGIRVLPEFDLPGHATSWFAGYPELASAPGPYEVDTVLMGLFEPVMNPANENVYDFLTSFFNEMADLFPDEYMHIGGDEVVANHWDENPDIQEFMSDKNFEDNHALQNYFNTRLQRILTNSGKQMVGWEEIQHQDLAEGIVVQAWKSQEALWNSVKSGYQAILSNGYYLDYKQPAGTHYSIDPEVIPGGVTIEVDTINWSAWDLEITFNDNIIPGTMFLFGTDGNYRGVVSSMGENQYSSFTTTSETLEDLRFEMETNFGEVKWELSIEGDSLSGTSSISIITLQVTGNKTGGSEMAGSDLPEFEKIEPLAESEKNLILGGEACMWSEMVDSMTVNSRIWPRAAAVAERLWSDPEYANDTDDMYRRLQALDKSLEDVTHHYERLNKLAASYVEQPLADDLLVLTELLEEVQFFGRMAEYPGNVITRSIRFDDPVDIARAESMQAEAFDQMVTGFIENGDNEAQLMTIFNQWKDSQDRLQNSLTDSTLVFHSQNLYNLADMGISILKKDAVLSSDKTEEQLDLSSQTRGSVNLSITSPMRRLVEHYHSIAN